MIRVGVFGAGGRMGGEVCRAVAGTSDCEIVAAVDPRCAGAKLDLLAPSAGVPPIVVAADPAAMAEAGADVAVDFTVAEAARVDLLWCAANGVHAVSGTTGLGAEAVDELRQAFAASVGNCVLAANFAIGAVVLMRLAEIAAPYMEGAEIIELHHATKVDAPSGTALATASGIARARAEAGRERWPARPAPVEILPGVRGGTGAGGVGIHSVRLPGLVAHQEVVFGAAGQALTIRHDAFDRTSFMPGVLAAVRAVSGHPGLTVGLAPVLGL